MTTVPEEAVKAADIIQVITDLRLAILQDDDEGLAEHAEPMIKAKELISRLSALPQLPGVGVEKLAWVKHPGGSHESAKDAFGGLYLASECGWRQMHSRWNDISGLEAAKAAAQADYAARIMSAIEVSAAETVIAVTDNSRFENTARNLIINQTSTDLENIINGHDPEVGNLNNDVWDRLDKMALAIEARILSALQPSAERAQALEEAEHAVGATLLKHKASDYEGLDSLDAYEAGQLNGLESAQASLRTLGTSREQLNKAVSNVPDQQENEPGAHGERERVLEEAAQALEAWGDIYGDNAAKCVRALSSQPVADGSEQNVSRALRSVAVLPASPDHADAGKVEGDGIGRGATVWIRVDENKDCSQEFTVTEAVGFDDVPDGEYLFVRDLPSAPSQEVAGS